MCFNKLERFKKLFPVRKWNKKVCCCVVRPKVLVEKQQQQIVVEVFSLTKNECVQVYTLIATVMWAARPDRSLSSI